MNETLDQIKKTEQEAERMLEVAKQNSRSITEDAKTRGEAKLADVDSNVAEDIEKILDATKRAVQADHVAANRKTQRHLENINRLDENKMKRAVDFIVNAITDKAA